MSSKFAGLVNMAMSGGMGSGRNHTEDATIARVAPSDKRDRPVESMVAVHRAVLAALRAIGEPHRTVLWAAHDHFVSPPEVKRELNVVARVALMTPAASSGYAESGRTGEPIEQWLIRACSREEDIAQIAKEAEAMLDVAYRAYAAAREPEPGRKGVGAFRKRDRTPRAPVPRRSVSAAFDPEGWRP
jgi:hypothetical protein